ncbi:hypothetical protein F2P81_009961 [Scophthalmus maximus]|uniref:Ubinuclein-1-like n=1 Tax=Scophthalmus maximus TaxID=52904 RepID=A0A6A4SUE9_SCOMX|nr:hypothetical protein F2P81_009961 [Scophthalmus maximus]
MAESRRVPLTTLRRDDEAPPVPKAPSRRCAPRADGGARPADADTVRLVVTLFEADERRFPEFSYSQLIAERDQINDSKDKVPQSTFEEEEEREDDEVAAIARKLEEKYGGKPKKKKDRIQDLIDIGYGYDDEDSFIDNSEAYDEFVPASITTKFGGFYVNSGVLQFRQTSDTETEDLTTQDPSKKRKLDGGRDKPKKKPCREAEETNGNMDSTSSALCGSGPNEEMKRKKKRKSVCTLSVTSMLKKFQREKEKERLKAEKANYRAAGITVVPRIPLCPADAAGGGGSGLTDPLLSLIGSTDDQALIQAASTMDFDIDLVSLLDASEETLSPKLVPQPATETQLLQPRTNDPTQLNVAPPPNTKTHFLPKTQPEQVALVSEGGSTSPRQCAPLPEGLTPGLEEGVRKLMVVVKSSEGESKLKFFTPEINSILLDIELQCRGQGVQLRSRLYTHLSSFLPCSRDTLLKRVKKLLLTHTEEPPDLEDPKQKLKEAIGKAMPEQVACYRANCQAYEQVKASKATEEETEGKQNVNVAPEDNVEERGVKRGGPKKSFKWNEEIRECLCHVLRPKMDRYEKERSGSQEVEEYLKTLLDSEVKPLWPKGWMQSRVKKARPDKKQSSISLHSVSAVSDVPHQAPPLKGELLQETEGVFTEGPHISNSKSLDAVKTEAAPLEDMEVKKGGEVTANAPTPAESSKPPVGATSAPAHSLLDLLADQALARKRHRAVSPELLAAAIAKYKRSGQHWHFEVDTKSPPPAPQSSQVNSPVCQVVAPLPLQAGDFTRGLDASQVQILSDDSGITIQ